MRVEPGLSPPLALVEHPPPLERGGRSFMQVLDATGAPGAAAPSAGSWTAVLVRTAEAERTVDSLIAAAARGRTFTPAQLLALQATVARGAQTVEVLSRAADRVVGAVKQTLNGQI
ncbi:MAG TPA: hypothetical protein VN962_02175 [Polyangia bacterium]|nr:hypothetical protein [Polyangia bacterium]